MLERGTRGGSARLPSLCIATSWWSYSYRHFRNLIPSHLLLGPENTRERCWLWDGMVDSISVIYDPCMRGLKSLSSTGTLWTGIRPASVMTTVTSSGRETS